MHLAGAAHALFSLAVTAALGFVLYLEPSAFNLALLVLVAGFLAANAPVHFVTPSVDMTPLPAMRFVCLALGTRGDVQPMIAIALELESRGHHATILAAKQFQSLVESFGLSFQSCGIDSFENQEAGWMTAQSPGDFMATVAKSFMNSYGDIGRALYEAAREKDCIIAGHSGTHLGLDVSDKTGAAVWTLHLMPEASTYYRPPFGEPDNWLGIVNKWRHIRRILGAIRAADIHKFTPRQNAFRRQVLDLPPVTLDRLSQAGYYMPAINAYSPLLVPQPPDWPPWQPVTGFCLVTNPDARLDPALAAFLQTAGEDRPVVVTFGSMSCMDAAGCDLVARSVRAVLRLRRRCVVVTGWTKPPAGIEADKDRLFITASAPHELLFPKCAAVVHHAGAGTTARCVLSGCPQVAVPILRWFDQAGWAETVSELSVGVHVRSPWCTEDELAEALRTILDDPLWARRAARLKSLLRDEEQSGVQKAVDHLLAPLITDSTRNGARMVERNCLHARAARKLLLQQQQQQQQQQVSVDTAKSKTT